jgi:hypothetical protein
MFSVVQTGVQTFASARAAAVFDSRETQDLTAACTVFAGGMLTAKVTAKAPNCGESRRTPANVSARAVGECGRLRLSVYIALSA